MKLNSTYFKRIVRFHVSHWSHKWHTLWTTRNWQLIKLPLENTNWRNVLKENYSFMEGVQFNPFSSFVTIQQSNNFAIKLIRSKLRMSSSYRIISTVDWPFGYITNTFMAITNYTNEINLMTTKRCGTHLNFSYCWIWLRVSFRTSLLLI